MLFCYSLLRWMLAHERVRLVERLRLLLPGSFRISAGMRAMRRQCSRRSQTTAPLAAHDGTCMHAAASAWAWGAGGPGRAQHAGGCSARSTHRCCRRHSRVPVGTGSKSRSWDAARYACKTLAKAAFSWTVRRCDSLMMAVPRMSLVPVSIRLTVCLSIYDGHGFFRSSIVFVPACSHETSAELLLRMCRYRFPCLRVFVVATPDESSTHAWSPQRPGRSAFRRSGHLACLLSFSELLRHSLRLHDWGGLPCVQAAEPRWLVATTCVLPGL